MLVGCVITFAFAFVQYQTAAFLPYIFIGAIFMAGQILEGFFLTPKLVGGKVGLHPVWVIFATMAGGHLLGFLGVLIALPVATILSVVLPHFLFKKDKTS